MSTGQPVPEQMKPENQHPDVAYTLIEATGEKIPFELGTSVEPEIDDPEGEKSEDEKKAELAPVITAVRELGTGIKGS